jgi:phosphoribosylformylglycinamidine synthase subunit PurS
MKFIAHINVMPHKELLDPQGKAVNNSLHNLGITQIQDVRIGKHITLHIDAANTDAARQLAEDACKKLLANQVMESFEVSVTEA